MAVVGRGVGRAESAGLREEFLARFDVVGSVTAVARERGINPHTAAGWVRRAGKQSCGRPGTGTSSGSRRVRAAAGAGCSACRGGPRGRGERADREGLGLRRQQDAQQPDLSRRAPRGLHHRHDHGGAAAGPGGESAPRAVRVADRARGHGRPAPGRHLDPQDRRGAGPCTFDGQPRARPQRRHRWRVPPLRRASCRGGPAGPAEDLQARGQLRCCGTTWPRS